ncbi:MAG TPA: class I adenylate-forming enzyme family protein [Acidimicrobiales bacterium]|nr:class I adenylate-forming enzyme family protein [Acidimicrobiales bacterium]
MILDRLTGPDALLQTVFRWHARHRPDALWCEFAGRGYSYAEVDGAANRLAWALQERHAVRKRDRVAVFMDNCPEYFAALFGIHRLGAVCVPCSTHCTPAELAFQLGHAEVAVAVVDDANAPVFRAAAERVPTPCILAEDLDSITGPFPASAPPPVDVTPADLATIMYTSGTTAHPKGVMFSHGNLRVAAETAVNAFRWGSADRYLHYFPLSHSNGGLHGVMPAIVAGATLVMIPKFSASRFGQQLDEQGITFTALNATNVRMLMRHPVTAHDRSHRAWRMMLGLSLGEEEIVAFEERFATRLCPTYGLTEGNSIAVIGEPVGPRRLGSAGRVVAGYEVRLPGAVGEAAIRSSLTHGVTMGYFQDPEQTAEVYRDGWLHTGDVLRADADGYLWFVERAKDMIKRSGFNVAPAEVERVIEAVPGVRDVVVVGVPDGVREEAVVAFVVTDGPLAVEDVLEACRRELAGYKVPGAVHVIGEIPRSVLGKVDRNALRAAHTAVEPPSAIRTAPVAGAQLDS